MGKNVNLVDGPIFKSLVRLALPIMGTSFVQMAYNMTDMIWLGKMGSGAVAAVGTAGFFTWLAFAFILIPKIGAEVGVAQSVGSGNLKETRSYIRHSIQMIVFIAVLYGLCMIILRGPLVGFFNLPEAWTISKARNYLLIVALGMVFYFINPVFTAIYNGFGDSKTPFKINVIGLVVNMVLDPLLIFGPGLFPKWGVEGAAIATITAQAVVTFSFILKARERRDIFKGINFLDKPDYRHIKRISKLGLPAALQSGMFTLFAMIIARIIAIWGQTPIAVQKVGSQIESISWMTAGGFQTALSAFVGQNFGAKRWDRVFKGYFAGIGLVTIVGVLATSLLVFGAGPVFSVFLSEAEALRIGIVYLKILGLSQLFMCIEITTAGAFNGLGKTVPPSVVGIVMNALRIPGALILSSTALGLEGVWWSISISSIIKGIVLAAWFIILLKRNPETANMKLFTGMKKRLV